MHAVIGCSGYYIPTRRQFVVLNVNANGRILVHWVEEPNSYPQWLWEDETVIHEKSEKDQSK